MFAYGAGNILSAVFEGMPAAGGLTRTLIVETTAGILKFNYNFNYREHLILKFLWVLAKTQMFSLISSVFVAVVVFEIGFLFEYLPTV